MSIYENLTHAYKHYIYEQIKLEYEENGLSVEDISSKLNVSKTTVQNTLLGKKYNGLGKSDQYIKHSNKRLGDQLELEVINDYNSGLEIPKILEKYNIDRARFGYIRQKYNIPDRHSGRCNDLKSITLEIDGAIKTYPSVENASQQTKIPTDFLMKLKHAQTFAVGKWSKENVAIVHDLNRLIRLERASELMGLILNDGSPRDKIDNGKELKRILFELGYSDEIDIELKK